MAATSLLTAVATTLQTQVLYIPLEKHFGLSIGAKRTNATTERLSTTHTLMQSRSNKNTNNLSWKNQETQQNQSKHYH